MNLCIEIVKIVLQCAGALLVTWLGVRFALDRYKREKMWEKHVTLYGEIISTYRKLIVVLGSSRRHINGELTMSHDQILDISTKYQKERDRLFDALSLGLVILPREQADKINTTLEVLSRYVSEEENPVKTVDAELKVLSDGLSFIIPIARKAAGSQPFD